MSDYRCSICGEYHPEYFKEHDKVFLCDRCKDIIDYWMKQMYQDLNTIARAENGKELERLEFEEAVVEFLGW